MLGPRAWAATYVADCAHGLECPSRLTWFSRALAVGSAARTSVERRYQGGAPWDIAPKGLAAVTDFATGACNTSRNWTDNSYLRCPGHRDRIVLIRQSKTEGGLNLYRSTRVTFDWRIEAGRRRVSGRALPHPAVSYEWRAWDKSPLSPTLSRHEHPLLARIYSSQRPCSGHRRGWRI